MSETAEQLSPLTAYEELMRFAKLRGESALRLAMHAAVPQGIQPELLHLLKRNFVPDAGDDPTIEVDILFSPLCEELGRGYFRFDSQVRALLLENLDANYADEPEPRIVKVADFILLYVDHYDRLASGNQDQLWRDYLEMQRWVAFAFANPSAAAQEFAAALEKASSTSDFVARIQLGGVASALAAPLSNFPRLLNYAAGVQALELGDRRRAAEFFDTLQDDELKIGNTTLRSTAQILTEWHARHPEYEAVQEPQISNEAEIDERLDQLDSVDIGIRTRAARILGQLPSRSLRVISALLEGLNDHSVEFRKACVSALADINTKEAVLGVAQAVADPDSQVGVVAVAALKEKQRSPVLIMGVSEQDEVMVESIQAVLLRQSYVPVFFGRPALSVSRFMEIARDVAWLVTDVAAAPSDITLLQSSMPFSIPVQPIAKSESTVSLQLSELQRDPSVLELMVYVDAADLRRKFQDVIIPSIQSWDNRAAVPGTEITKDEFEYDVFISYALADNQAPPHLRGHIDSFTERLSIRLAELIGREPRVFRDVQLTEGIAFGESIRDAINKSAALIPLLSDAYLKAEFCRLELEAMTAVVAESESERRRIFPVFIHRVPEERLPPSLQKSAGYDLRWETDNPYPEIDSLVSDISKFLHSLKTEEESPAPSYDDVPPQLSTVYLAETTRELRDERDRLKRRLEAQGYRVLPDRPLPITAAEFKRAVQDYLRISQISIHLLGQKYGSYPDGGNRSMPELQFNFAGERITDLTFTRIVWMPSGAKPESTRQRQLFDIAVAEQRQTDVLRTSPEDLEDSLLDRLERLAESSKTVTGSPQMATDINVLLVYEHKDEIFRRKLLNHLNALWGEGLITSMQDLMVAPGFESYADIERKLSTSNLVLLLISSTFLRSDFAFGDQIKRAIEGHNVGSVIVLPILVHPVSLGESLYSDLLTLPSNYKAISEWANDDQAYADIMKTMRTVIRELHARQAEHKPVNKEPELAQRTPERWPVRTGTDQDVSKVNLNPVETTIQHLIDQMRPLDMPRMSGVESKYHSRRAEPVETTVWSVNASIRAFKLNPSESYLLILEGRDGVTMRAEVPDPLRATESPWQESFARVRNKLQEKLPFSSSFSYLEPSVNVRIWGVGFFSGFHGQKHAAPNGIELQPILDIEWLPNRSLKAPRPNPNPRQKKASGLKSSKSVTKSSQKARASNSRTTKPKTSKTTRPASSKTTGAAPSRKAERPSSGKSKSVARVKTSRLSAKKQASKKNVKKR